MRNSPSLSSATGTPSLNALESDSRVHSYTDGHECQDVSQSAVSGANLPPWALAGDIRGPSAEVAEVTGAKRYEDTQASRTQNEGDGFSKFSQSAIETQSPSMRSTSSNTAPRNNLIDRDNDGTPASAASAVPKEKKKENPVRWRDLPSKGQLAVLTMARLSEPLTQTSLQSYMFYQLQSFDPSLPDATISSQVGLLAGCFTFAQFVTAMIWGRIADSPRVGRKRVLLAGLLGTAFSCIGYGFSRNFWQAVAWRTLGGALNGNVGVMRTMISEIVQEKK